VSTVIQLPPNRNTEDAKPGTLVPTSPEKVGTKVPTFWQCSMAVEANWGKHLLVGRCLGMIRDNELYKKAGYRSWEECCRCEWKRTKRACDYLIAQAQVADQLKLKDDFPAARLRPLVGLTPEHRKEAWAGAESITQEGKQPSGAAIKLAASKFKAKTMEWTLRAAVAVFQQSVKRGVERALVGAIPQQAQEFLGELPEQFDHCKQMLCGPMPQEEKVPNQQSDEKRTAKKGTGI
jgi:hypothetical protein